jgi:uncharacterized protein YeaO (DUF488 family)
MSISIVRLGSPRREGEGLRIGTVRRPPRGVPKDEYASRDFFDVWFPNLSPSESLLKAAQPAASEQAWRVFARQFRTEMNVATARRDLELLAALSRHTDIAIGCYCADEMRCHRSLLRQLLEQLGAAIDP